MSRSEESKAHSLAYREKVEGLLERARAGDAAAAQELFDAYAPQFRYVIRCKLAPRVRNLLDSEDFLQDTRVELFNTSDLTACQSVEGFVAFLSKVAERKVLAANRKYLDYQGKNLNREQSLDKLTETEQPISALPSAHEHVVEQEQWEGFLRDRPLLHRQVLGLLRQGYTHCEVADELHINEKSVRRLTAETSSA